MSYYWVPSYPLWQIDQMVNSNNHLWRIVIMQISMSYYCVPSYPLWQIDQMVNYNNHFWRIVIMQL